MYRAVVKKYFFDSARKKGKLELPLPRSVFPAIATGRTGPSSVPVLLTEKTPFKQHILS
jgi:hypothetical protein